MTDFKSQGHNVRKVALLIKEGSLRDANLRTRSSSRLQGSETEHWNCDRTQEMQELCDLPCPHSVHSLIWAKWEIIQVDCLLGSELFQISDFFPCPSSPLSFVRYWGSNPGLPVYWETVVSLSYCPNAMNHSYVWFHSSFSSVIFFLVWGLESRTFTYKHPLHINIRRSDLARGLPCPSWGQTQHPPSLASHSLGMTRWTTTPGYANFT